jgi:hypothetical protein
VERHELVMTDLDRLKTCSATLSRPEGLTVGVVHVLSSGYRECHARNAGLSVMLHIDSWAPYNASEGFSQANMRHAKFVTRSDSRWLFVDRTSVAETAL